MLAPLPACLLRVRGLGAVAPSPASGALLHGLAFTCIGVAPTYRYILSTCLSLYNKFLVGKKYGIFGHVAFPGAGRRGRARACMQHAAGAQFVEHCSAPSPHSCQAAQHRLLPRTCLACTPSTRLTLCPLYLPRACPAAPLFMSATQFALQCLLARATLWSEIIPRTGHAMTWPEWTRNGAC